MKNMIELLSEIGITIPDDQRAAFEAAVSQNYKTIHEYERQQTALTRARADLDTAREALKSFEGVDVAELNSRIQQLQTDLDTSKTAHEEELAKLDFSHRISTAIQRHKGRNEKAIMALLDMDSLMQSERQEDAIQSSLDALAAESPYLFDLGTTPPPYAAGTGTQGAGDTLLNSIYAAAGVSPDK